MTEEFFIVVAVIASFVWISGFMLLRIWYSDTKESNTLPDPTEDQIGNSKSIVMAELDSTPTQASQSHEAEQSPDVDSTGFGYWLMYPFVCGLGFLFTWFSFASLPFICTLIIALMWFAVVFYFSLQLLTSHQRKALNSQTTACLNKFVLACRSIMSLFFSVIQQASRIVSSVLTSRKNQGSGEFCSEMSVNELLELKTVTDQRTPSTLAPPPLPSRSGQNMTQWSDAKANQKCAPFDSSELNHPHKKDAPIMNDELLKQIDKRLKFIAKLLAMLVIGSIAGLITLAFGRDVGQIAAVISLVLFVMVAAHGIVLW